MTAADQLRDAAFLLRNPFHPPGLKVGIDAELGFLLADWLDREGQQETYTLAEFGHRSACPEALAVAREILGQPDRNQT